ncbi:Dyp-type peroxidase [Dactylosporangium sp. NPDC048998]|uniref:Dyp-type peroxidase n=1 Tax=Dactylosporangium sp. NPDC048998 TaxID=3363976 RepID=UPI00371E723D
MSDTVLRRRALLQGAAGAVAGIAGVAGAASCGGPAQRPAAAPTHQPGVLTPPPDSSAFAAFDVVAADRTGLATLMDRLAVRAAAPHAADLTITLAVGAGLFDARFGLAGQRPAGLQAMPAFPNDVLAEQWSHGDLLVQVCAPQQDAARAVLADLTQVAGTAAKVRWQLDGFRPENGVDAEGRPTTRNLFGFREGAGNPDPRDQAEMDRLVWVGGDDGGPSWTRGGTYQVVRLVRFAGVWNTEPVTRQEAVIGRRKNDGAPLGHSRETEPFDYQADPDGRLIPRDAHIRLANPRVPSTEASRILRRGYSYRLGTDAAGQADEGLIFVCFQRDIERGFATVQRRMAGQPLDRYVLTFGGGYYFVPPDPASFAALLRA